MSSQSDRRQLAQMSAQIVRYEASGLSLGGLIADLEFLLDAIQSIDLAWKRKIDRQIETLEIAHARMLEAKRNEMRAVDVPLVERAVQEIKALLIEVKEDDSKTEPG